MKRVLLASTVCLLSGCYSWNMMMPASPLGYGGKEVMGYYGVNLSPQMPYPNGLDGPMGARLRLGSSPERDMQIGFAFERPCNDVDEADHCNPAGTTRDSAVYRLEIAMQHNYFESQGFYVSQGEGFGLGLITSPNPGSLPITIGPATWFTVGFVPVEQAEIYVSGRLSSEMGAVAGIRGRYSKFVGYMEVGYYVPIMFDLSGAGGIGLAPPRVGISFALGYADDGHKSSMFGPIFGQQPPPTALPPPPPPPPISAPPPPPPVNTSTYAPPAPAPVTPAPGTAPAPPPPPPAQPAPTTPAPSQPGPSGSTTPPIPN